MQDEYPMEWGTQSALTVRVNQAVKALYVTAQVLTLLFAVFVLLLFYVIRENVREFRK